MPNELVSTLLYRYKTGAKFGGTASVTSVYVCAWLYQRHQYL